MKQGDIHWLELPPLQGHEQAGRRPGVVIQADSYTERLSTIVVVPMTSNAGVLRYPGTFVIEPNAENGLSAVSVAMVFQVRVIDKRRIGPRIGTLDDVDYNQLLMEFNRLAARGRDAHPL